MIDDDDIIDDEFGGRNGNDAAASLDPGAPLPEFQQLADRPLCAGRGQIADPIAEPDQPCDYGAGDQLTLTDRRSDRQCVQEVDIQPAFSAQHTPGALGNRIGTPEEKWHVNRHRHRVH